MRIIENFNINIRLEHSCADEILKYAYYILSLLPPLRRQSHISNILQHMRIVNLSISLFCGVFRNLLGSKYYQNQALLIKWKHTNESIFCKIYQPYQNRLIKSTRANIYKWERYMGTGSYTSMLLMMCRPQRIYEFIYYESCCVVSARRWGD